MRLLLYDLICSRKVIALWTIFILIKKLLVVNYLLRSILIFGIASYSTVIMILYNTCSNNFIHYCNVFPNKRGYVYIQKQIMATLIIVYYFIIEMLINKFVFNYIFGFSFISAYLALTIVIILFINFRIELLESYIQLGILILYIVIRYFKQFIKISLNIKIIASIMLLATVLIIIGQYLIYKNRSFYLDN